MGERDSLQLIAAWTELSKGLNAIVAVASKTEQSMRGTLESVTKVTQSTQVEMHRGVNAIKSAFTVCMIVIAFITIVASLFFGAVYKEIMDVQIAHRANNREVLSLITELETQSVENHRTIMLSQRQMHREVFDLIKAMADTECRRKETNAK